MNGPNDLHNTLDEAVPDEAQPVDGAELQAWEALLTRALRPIEPPPGFADTVLRRAGVSAESSDAPEITRTGPRLIGEARGGQASPRRGLAKLLAWPTAHLEAWGAGALAAAALALAIFAGHQTEVRKVDERKQAQAAERRALANQQFEASVRIMDQTMEHTREQLRRVGVAGLD